MSDDTELARVFINLNGNFELGDGRIGTVASTPELSELNAFLGVIKGILEPTTKFDELFARLGKKFRKQKGSVLEVRTRSDGKELVHTFAVTKQDSLTYEETDELLTQAGWSLDCWSPLEISRIDDSSSKATGEAASIVIEHLQLVV